MARIIVTTATLQLEKGFARKFEADVIKEIKKKFRRVGSAIAKRTENAIKLLVAALYNITNKKYTKNKLACHGPFGPCDFYKTEHCI